MPRRESCEKMFGPACEQLWGLQSLWMPWIEPLVIAR